MARSRGRCRRRFSRTFLDRTYSEGHTLGYGAIYGLNGGVQKLPVPLTLSISSALQREPGTGSTPRIGHMILKKNCRRELHARYRALGIGQGQYSV